tara:strand:- start:66515 stop:66793 length:279 start_codon:yes stop_codon:yes gene_type:complete
MGSPQGCEGVFNPVVCAHYFDFELIHVFNLTLLPQEGLTSFKRPKLTLSSALPCTTIVISDFPGAGIKYCPLGRLKMRLRHKKAQLEHNVSL